MPNIITVTKNNTSGSERWDIAYTVDASGTVEKTIFTAGTLFDRNEKISIITPAISLPASATSSATSGATLQGTISRSTSAQYINIPAGYNDTPVYYLVSATSNMTLPSSTSTSASGSSQLVINTSASTRYLNIPVGYNSSARYYTIRPVTTANISAANIKSGVTITVGDSASAGRIANVAGTFTSASTVSSGQTAAAAAQLLSGYSAWVNGAEVKGNIATKTSSNVTASGATVTIPAGYYATQVTKTISNGSVTAPSSISGTGATLSTSGTGTLTLTKTVSVTPNVTTAGYISSGTAGNASVSLSANVDIRSSSDLSVSGNVVTVPAGYYPSGSTISATVPSSTLTNAIINGAAVVETTNDYGFEVTVSIPEGYHNAGTVTKLFSSMLPLPTGTEGTASQVLAGYSLYNHNGQLITGSMTNNGAWNQTLDQTTTSVTIPAGYHNGSGTVSHATVNIPDPTITVNTSGLVTASGSWTRGFTTDNSYSNTFQIAAAAKSTSLSGGTLGCDKQSSANITMSTTDSYTNGVSVTFRGSRAATTATTAITTAGYAAVNSSFSTASLAADTVDSTYYIQGVTLTAPASGLRCFDITVPNGTNDTMTFHFEVDSSSNVTITDSHTT